MGKDRKKRTVAVDLDGTLAHYDGWKGTDQIGEPLTGAKELLETLINSGYYVIIHSCRLGSQLFNPDKYEDIKQLTDSRFAVKDWLDYHKMPYDELWLGFGKPAAVAYIEDRAVPVEKNLGYVSAFQPGTHVIENIIESIRQLENR